MDRLVRFLTTTDSGGKANWNIIDNFNDHFFLGGAVDFSPGGSECKGLSQFYARLQSISRTLANEGEGRQADQIDQRAAYSQQLERSRFSPLKVFNAPKAKVDAEGFTPASKKKKDKASALEQNRSYLAIRRACKFGLGLAATNAAFMGAKVHFLLDGLDMQEVANKASRVGYGGRTAVSITTSELRYAFRYWGRLSGVITFYVNLQPVAAPWLNDWSLSPLAGRGPDPTRLRRKSRSGTSTPSPGWRNTRTCYPTGRCIDRAPVSLAFDRA